MTDETRLEDIAELVQIARSLQSTIDLARAAKEKIEKYQLELSTLITDVEDIQGELEDLVEQVEHLKEAIEGEDEDSEDEGKN